MKRADKLPCIRFGDHGAPVEVGRASPLAWKEARELMGTAYVAVEDVKGHGYSFIQHADEAKRVAWNRRAL